jgi:hypothetical protein
MAGSGLRSDYADQLRWPRQQHPGLAAHPGRSLGYIYISAGASGNRAAGEGWGRKPYPNTGRKPVFDSHIHLHRHPTAAGSHTC